MKLNNVDLERISKEAQAIKADPSKGKRVNKLEATWSTDPSKPQLQATVKYEQGQVVMECDSPTFMGGEGRRPGPLHYCIMGFAACYTSTFATSAAAKNISLKSLSVAAECELDFSKAYGVNENPIVKNATFTVNVKSDAPRSKLEEVKEEALAKCPGIFVLRNNIPVTARIA